MRRNFIFFLSCIFHYSLLMSCENRIDEKSEVTSYCVLNFQTADLTPFFIDSVDYVSFYLERNARIKNYRSRLSVRDDRIESDLIELEGGDHLLLDLYVCSTSGDTLLRGVPKEFSFLCGSGLKLPSRIKINRHPVFNSIEVSVSNHSEIKAWELAWGAFGSEFLTIHGWSLLVRRYPEQEEAEVTVTMDMICRNSPITKWYLRKEDVFRNSDIDSLKFFFTENQFIQDQLEVYRISFLFPNDEVWEGDLSVEDLLIVETDLLENNTTLQCLILSEDSRFHKIDNAFPEDPSDPF